MREKGGKETQGETWRDKDKATHCLTDPQFLHPKAVNTPRQQAAAAEQRLQKCWPGSCGGTHRLGDPSAFFPFRGCPLAPIARCAPLTAWLPAPSRPALGLVLGAGLGLGGSR